MLLFTEEDSKIKLKEDNILSFVNEGKLGLKA